MTVTREIACSDCGKGKTLDINRGFTFGHCVCGNDLDAQMVADLSKTALAMRDSACFVDRRSREAKA